MCTYSYNSDQEWMLQNCYFNAVDQFGVCTDGLMRAYRLNMEDWFADDWSAMFIHMLSCSWPSHAYPSKSSFMSPFRSTTIGKLPFADGMEKKFGSMMRYIYYCASYFLFRKLNLPNVLFPSPLYRRMIISPSGSLLGSFWPITNRSSFPSYVKSPGMTFVITKSWIDIWGDVLGDKNVKFSVTRSGKTYSWQAHTRYTYDDARYTPI